MKVQTTFRVACGALLLPALALATLAALLFFHQKHFEETEPELRQTTYLYVILSICGFMIALTVAMFVAAQRRMWAPLAAPPGQARSSVDLQRLAQVAATKREVFFS